MQAHERYDSLFQFYGDRAGVDWRLLKAQAQAESGRNLDPDARSKVGATGIAQFMVRTWEEWRDGTPGIQEPPPADIVLLDPRDPEDGIRVQAAYIAWILRHVGGRLETALAAYNWGIGNVRRALPDLEYDPAKVPDETRAYVARILDYRTALEG
jgi:soluble lytic murein transglycosylase-like protein